MAEIRFKGVASRDGDEKSAQEFGPFSAESPPNLFRGLNTYGTLCMQTAFSVYKGRFRYLLYEYELPEGLSAQKA